MTVCQQPPPGWRCTREAGHDGPCAALPVSDSGRRYEFICTGGGGHLLPKGMYGTPANGEILAPLADLESALVERALAIAHDRQPYPTADAYETVCAARTKWQQRAEMLEERLSKVATALDAEIERRHQIGSRNRSAVHFGFAERLEEIRDQGNRVPRTEVPLDQTTAPIHYEGDAAHRDGCPCETCVPGQINGEADHG